MIGGDGGGVGNKTTCACVEAGKGVGQWGRGRGGEYATACWLGLFLGIFR